MFIFYFNGGDKWVDWSCRGRMGKWSTCYHRRDSHLKSYLNLLLCIPVSGGGHKREVLPMPWRQRKPPRSGINPLTQNLPELDRLISYIQASVILQYRLKHIDNDSNTVKKSRKHRWKHSNKFPGKDEQNMNMNSLILGVDSWAKMREWFETDF